MAEPERPVGDHVCSELKPGVLCLVVQQYHEGQFIREFHDHIPASRLSVDARINLLRALVVRFWGFSGMGAEFIVGAYLNARGKTPPSNGRLRITTTYPEPGVLRHHCGGNTAAWIDDVVSVRSFRQTERTSE
jgi:hypothetical protein